MQAVTQNTQTHCPNLKYSRNYSLRSYNVKMKSKFNPKHPLLKKMFGELENRASAARDILKKMPQASVPLYVLNLSKPPGISNPPIQIASGVLIKLSTEHFIFTASHAIEEYKDYPVIIGCEGKFHFLNGDRFSTGKGASGTHQDDPLDAAVFHIQKDQVTDDIKSCALNLEHLDLTQPTGVHLHIATGFIASRSKFYQRSDRNPIDVCSFFELDSNEYSKLKLNESEHVALSGDTQIVINDTWQTAPSLKGMSGCGIYIIYGIPQDIKLSTNNESLRSAKLTAILIEHRTKTSLIKAVVGIRIKYHLAMIDKFLPHIGAWINEEITKIKPI